jgi:hypothetical protein
MAPERDFTAEIETLPGCLCWLFKVNVAHRNFKDKPICRKGVGNWRQELIELVIPSLPEYGEKPILLVGCRSSDIFYEVCEIDILILGSRKRGVELITTRTGVVEIHRVGESAAEITRSSPHYLSHARPLYDPHFTMGGILGRFAAESRRRWVREQVVEAMAMLGRARTCHRAGDGESAFLWLMASAYKLIGSLLVNSGTSYSPSHFITLLRAQSSALYRKVYTASAEALRLGFADKLSVGRRLEVLRMLRRYQEHLDLFKSIQRKVRFMGEREMFLEAYSMLGYRILESAGLLGGPRPAAKPPEAYHIRLPERVKRMAFPGLEDSFDEVAGRMEESILEAWREVSRPPQR